MFNHLCLCSLLRFRLHLITLCLLLSLGTGRLAIADNSHIQIVTDIAPIHSLVSMIVGEHANIELLVPPSQSPHSYTLKPSQVSSISKANLVIILSSDFTPSLSRHLSSINKHAVLLELSSSNSSHEHNESHSNPDTLNIETAEAAEADKINRRLSLEQDPHTWLNPNNAIDWLDDIAAAAIQVDQQNKTVYQHNAEQAKISLTQLQQTLTEQLSVVRSVAYIVYHDAYRHFAYSYGLRDPIAIAMSDARAPGAAKLRTIRAKINQTNCVFSEVLHDDAIVDMVSEGVTVNRGILDPMGSRQTLGPAHYSATMRAMTNTFLGCLGN